MKNKNEENQLRDDQKMNMMAEKNTIVMDDDPPKIAGQHFDCVIKRTP